MHLNHLLSAIIAIERGIELLHVTLGKRKPPKLIDGYQKELMFQKSQVLTQKDPTSLGYLNQLNEFDADLS